MIDKYEICQRLLLHEGLRLQPYRCSKGKLTIGIGRNIDDNPFTDAELKVIGDWKHGITTQAAFYLLRNDIDCLEKELQRKINFWHNLSDERQYALLDIAFNIGVCGLLKFKKMLAWLWMGNFEQAAIECLNSKYAKDTGHRAKRIATLIRTENFER